nr:immunoglobulin heavy chain junction region [Macaca mulatta]MOW49386.1 immunoglobulin heavy chain junction region [Macaca mulatta]MOW50306.1 immunoglobulin heavy chain junction region [Macaca mulatta]
CSRHLGILIPFFNYW